MLLSALIRRQYRQEYVNIKRLVLGYFHQSVSHQDAISRLEKWIFSDAQIPY